MEPFTLQGYTVVIFKFRKDNKVFYLHKTEKLLCVIFLLYVRVKAFKSLKSRTLKKILSRKDIIKNKASENKRI